MIGTQLLFTDRQRPLQERLRLRMLALRPVEQGQAVQADCRVGMLWPQLLFTDGQRPLGVLPWDLVDNSVYSPKGLTA